MCKMCPLESIIIKAGLNSVKCFELLNECFKQAFSFSPLLSLQIV